LGAFAAAQVLGEVLVHLADEVVHLIAADAHFGHPPALQHGAVAVREAGFVGDAVHEEHEHGVDFVVGEAHFHGYVLTVSAR